MQADAIWENIADELDGVSITGFDYRWQVPQGDGSVSEIQHRLEGEHRGSSLLDNAIPPGEPLRFSVRGVYGEATGEFLTVACSESIN